MSKGKGQRIAIKFNKPITGDVSGSKTLVTGCGLDTDNLKKSENAALRTNGWRFTALSDMMITHFRVFTDGAQNVTMHIWNNTSASIVVQASFVTGTGMGWSEYKLPLPVFLLKNENYTVTANYPINGGYYYYDAYNNGVEVFTDAIKFLGGYRVDSHNTYPTSMLTPEPGVYDAAVDFRFSSYIGTGNEAAFNVTGMQKSPIHVGNPVLKEYKVDRIERYIMSGEAADDTILLTFDRNNGFNNVEGDITVSYNQNIGDLKGTRAVPSFAIDFTPDGLEPTPNHEHHIETKVTGALLSYTKVNYMEEEQLHTVSVSLNNIIVEFISIDEIDP